MNKKTFTVEVSFSTVTEAREDFHDPNGKAWSAFFDALVERGWVSETGQANGAQDYIPVQCGSQITWTGRWHGTLVV